MRARGPGFGIWTILLAAAVLFGPSTSFAGNFEGVASCAGSTCHGRAEGNGAVVRQDELLQWQEPSSKTGAHSRAYSVLSGQRSRQIAATLGLGPATSAPACIGCHATNAGGQSGPRFRLSEGVGCESCHGASSAWLPTHFTLGANRSANIARGLIPLENPRTRARVCLDCHFGSGNPGQFVTHRMMAAGHPRLSFELDLFSALQQHHNEDADYAARKGRLDSVQLWAVGQAEAVKRSVSLFADPKLGTEGVFPEFYFYDCHSCHRRIDDGPQRTLSFQTNPGRPIPFGMPPYNDENILMLSAVAKVLAPRQAASFDSASRQFHAAMGGGRGAAVAAAGKLAGAADGLSAGLAAGGHGSDTAFRVIATIAGEAVSDRFTDYSGSVQAVMAVDTLLNALVRQGRITVGAAAGIRADVNRAYAAVRAPNAYNPAAFRAALGSAARAVAALK